MAVASAPETALKLDGCKSLGSLTLTRLDNGTPAAGSSSTGRKIAGFGKKQTPAESGYRVPSLAHSNRAELEAQTKVFECSELYVQLHAFTAHVRH